MIEEYARELEYRGLSEASKKRYLEVVTDFLYFCKKKDFGEEDARKFLEWKMKRCKGGALRFYYSILKNFYGFLNPDFKGFSFDPPSQPRDVNRPLFSEEEIFRMLELAEKSSERDYLLLRLFYASGARRMEIARAEKDDIYIEGGYAFFRIKHGKTEPRVVPIDLETADRILKWRRKQRLGNSLFGISESDISYIIKKWRERAGIKKERAGGHAFRRSYASHLRARGMDILDIKDSLGHKNISMTSIYAQLEPIGLAKKLKAKHPLFQWK